jgi:hypothetical protein
MGAMKYGVMGETLKIEQRGRAQSGKPKLTADGAKRKSGSKTAECRNTKRRFDRINRMGMQTANDAKYANGRFALLSFFTIGNSRNRFSAWRFWFMPLRWSLEKIQTGLGYRHGAPTEL